MRIKLPDQPRREPDLTGLINIVFLILIFFVIAGTLRPFSDASIELAEMREQGGQLRAPGRLVITQDGAITYRGQDISAARLGTVIEQDSGLDRDAAFVIVADRRLPALKTLEAVRAVRAAGVPQVSVMVESKRQ